MEMYGREWPDGTTRLQIELTMYRHAPPGDERFHHCKIAYAMLYPELIPTWNSWSEKIMYHFCHEARVGGCLLSILGASGTGKSMTMGYLSVLDWLAAPDDTLILTASDTIAGLNQRIWKYVRQAYRNIPFQVGNLRLSKPEAIVADNLEGGINAVALENDPGSEKLKGFHPKRLRIIVDEATAVSAACLAHEQNWKSAGKEFILVCLSNFRGFDNLAGVVSEPVNGYASIDYDITQTWKSKLNGTVILLDALQSPVYKNPHLKSKLPFLKTKEEIDRIIYGTEDHPGLGENHPRVLQYIRSIPAWDEGARTVLTRKMLTKGGAFQPAKWAGWGRTELLSLDPAFVTSGDECILQRGTLGYETDGTQVLEFGETISIPINSNSATPTEYQILEYVVSYCVKHNIPPENFAMDAAGQGRGLGSIFQYEWSDKVLLVQPGQSPSEKIVDFQFNKTAREVYDRYLTELWYDARTFVETAQLRKLPEKAANELCTRIYNDTKAKIRLETKPEYKLRTSGMDSVDGSPDTSDACTYLIALAQEHGLQLANRKRAYAEVKIETRQSREEQAVADWIAQREAAWVAEQNVANSVTIEYDYSGDNITDND
jgi:hypothetical protein